MDNVYKDEWETQIQKASSVAKQEHRGPKKMIGQPMTKCRPKRQGLYTSSSFDYCSCHTDSIMKDEIIKNYNNSREINSLQDWECTRYQKSRNIPTMPLKSKKRNPLSSSWQVEKLNLKMESPKIVQRSRIRYRS